MQVHYNLLAGDDARRVRGPAAAGAARRPTSPRSTRCCCPRRWSCRAGPATTTPPLCDRATALADVKARFGERAGSTADFLYFLCGGGPVAGNTQSCTRTMLDARDDLRRRRPHAPARPLHHGSRSTRAPPRARTVLDIPVWNFDDQGAKPIDPVRLDAGDQVKVTCRHVQWLRDELPVVRGPGGALRRVGRGHHRRDVPRHAAAHPPLTAPRRSGPHLSGWVPAAPSA